jgi:hypothetical protein
MNGKILLKWIFKNVAGWCGLRRVTIGWSVVNTTMNFMIHKKRDFFEQLSDY